MSGRYVLDEHGEPTPEPDLETWARWFENPHARRVAWSEIGEWQISTV